MLLFLTVQLLLLHAGLEDGLTAVAATATTIIANKTLTVK